jgi:hypothetical protein
MRHATHISEEMLIKQPLSALVYCFVRPVRVLKRGALVEVFHMRRSRNVCSAKSTRLDQEPVHMLLLLGMVKNYFISALL